MNENDRTRAEQEERLGELISDWLEARQAGQALDQREWLARYPEFAEELREFLCDESQLRALAAPLRQTAQEARVNLPVPGDAMPTLPAAPPGGEGAPASLDQYEVLEELGRGGMAVVYRARQKKLGRFVALKLFRADCLERTAELQRFRLEAEIVAHLDHPQIVPVYDVGECDGRGFFTMKLMDGGGLDAQLTRFAADPLAAAGLVACVARAVHHAHQRGILHRDLKPSNILLSGGAHASPAEYRPHVSDFGLAKRVGVEAGLTHSGAVVGTPAYMAPEQAAGAKNAVTTAADIYGLGAVLYSLLTGRAPFGGSSVLDVLTQVKEREPEQPRRINPRVPRDLETICLKCLHKEPHQRYESAAAVAEDLERWLRGEPIAARPVGTIGRLRRWAFRQPVQAALALALLLTGLTGFGLVFWQWRRAEANLATADALRREAETNLDTMTALRQEAETNLATMTVLRNTANTARQEAVESKTESDTSFRLAHQAIREITGLLESGGQLESHGLDPLHREVLLRAQSYFERFLKYRSRDRALRLDQAQSSVALAEIIRLTGTPPDALDAHRRAIDQVEALLRDDPDDPALNGALAQLHNQFGSIHDTLGHGADALASLKRAGVVMDRALARQPADRPLQSGRASTHHNLGMIYVNANRLDDALASYTEAQKIYDKLHHSQPDDADIQHSLANTLNSIGIVRIRRGQLNEARRAFENAIELSEPLAKRYPNNRLMKQALARHLCNLGDVLAHQGEPKKALEPLERARGALEELVRTSPSVTDFHFVLSQCYTTIAYAQTRLGDLVRACDALERARVLLRGVVEANPQVVDYRRRLSQLLMDLAQNRHRLNQREPSLDTFREGRAVIGRLVDSYPDEPEFLSCMGVLLNNRALAEAEMVSAVDARASVREAINYHQRALDKRDTEGKYRRYLSVSHALHAAIERETGHIDEALDANVKRRTLWPNNGNELYVAACDFVRIGNVVKADAPKQNRCYDLACETLGLAVKAGFWNADEATKDSILAPLRAREDFQKLLGEMKNAQGPKSTPRGGGP